MVVSWEVGWNILSILLFVTWLLYLGTRLPHELLGDAQEILNSYRRTDKDSSYLHIL